MNKIIFTGTAPGLSSVSRISSSFILQVNKKLYQFDAGEGFSGSALRHKIRYNDIEKIFITHLHPDHITGLFLELQLMYLTGRRKPLDIYVPDEAIEGLLKATDLFYLFREKFPFSYRFKPIKPNPVYRGKEFSIYAYLNRHLTGNRKAIKEFRKHNRMQSYSYIINRAGKRILYSGDIQDETDLGGMLENTHTAIIEGLHVDCKKLIELCSAFKIKKLVLTHLDEKLYKKPDRIIKAARETGLKKLVIAEDGLVIRL